MPAFDTAGVNLTPLHFAKFTFSEMLPTALYYTTPGQLSRGFFRRQPGTGRQRQQPHPPPAPGRVRTSEGTGQAGPNSSGSGNSPRHWGGLTTARRCATIQEHRRWGRASGHFKRGPARKGWPSFFVAWQREVAGVPPAAQWQPPAPRGPTGLPFPPCAAGRRACSAPCGRFASVARGSARCAALFPDRRHGGGWARASRSAHHPPAQGRSRLRRCPCGAALRRLLAARSVAASVLLGPRPPYGGGPGAFVGLRFTPAPARCAGAGAPLA